MNQAIADLTHEHEAILFALQILERMAERASRGELAADDLAGFLGFLREFVDKCHHGKEEGLLFPAMIEAGLAPHGGFVAELLAEHEQGRGLIASMEQAATQPLQTDAFVATAQAYVDQLRRHIDKENAVFFPMAQRLLDSASLEALHQAFEEHEARVIGLGRHEQLHALLRQLKAEYLD